MNVFTMLCIYLAVGAAGGTMAGIFGIGGGLITVPALAFVFTYQGIAPDVVMHLAIGTSLATIVVTGISSAYGHFQRNSVHKTYFLQLLPGLMLGAVIGVFIAGKLSGGMLGKMFGVFLLLIALKIALDKGKSITGRPARPWVMHIAGLFIGSISALFGVGGGTLSVPWLLSRGVSMTQAAGTSSACGIFIALFGATTFCFIGWGNPLLPAWTSGFIMWPAFLAISLTSIPFAHVGVRLAHTLPAKTVKQAFGVVLLLVGLKFLF